MKLDFLCRDGSPLGVTAKTLWGDDHRIGLGGAEQFMITLCEEWTKRGYEVTLYNDPWEVGASSFEQRPINAFVPQDNRDVLIVFRSPNDQAVIANGFKVWLSTDQYTIGSFGGFRQFVDKVVVISEFHADHFESNYIIDDSIPIDIPVRLDDLKPYENVEKVPYRCIFTSIPDRGLSYLRQAWPKIKRDVPEASLVITSDYRLWGNASPGNQRHQAQWLGLDDVTFLAAVKRERLLKEQAQAQMLIYPSKYPELFCLAVAEASCMNIYPITSSSGALETTNMGKVIPGVPTSPGYMDLFASKAIKMLKNRDGLMKRCKELKKKATERFAPDNILKQWDEKVFVDL